MTSCRTRLTEVEWLHQKPNIRRMVIDQNLSQEEARRLLKDDGFLVTKAQLEYKLKIWGLRKKAPKEKSDALWQFIGHRVGKRTRQDKASNVFLNGRLVDPVKVRKEINRHQPSSLVRLEQDGMSPRTPGSPEVFIRTPGSTSMQPVWPSCSPWLQFQQSLSLSLAFLQPLAVPGHVPIKIVAKKEESFLYSITHLVRKAKIRNVSSLTACLNVIMPEACKDENRGRAQLLLRGSTNEVLLERLKLVFYQVSNKLGRLSVDSDGWFSIVALIEESGVMKMPLQLEVKMDATLLSVAESLFQQAFGILASECQWKFRERNIGVASDTTLGKRLYRGWEGDMVTKLPSWRIIKWLLSSEQDPNTPVSGSDGYRLTPLQLAVDLSSPHLVRLMLEAKSDPNVVYDMPRHPILSLLHGNINCADKIRLLKRFLEAGASVRLLEHQQGKSSIMAALAGFHLDFHNDGLELLDILIDNKADICGKHTVYSDLFRITSSCSVFGCAAGLPDEPMAMSCLQHLLERAQQANPSLAPAHLISSDVWLIAASKGYNQVLELLHGFGVDLTGRGDTGITALHAAVYYGHLESCQTLLEFGVPVDNSLEFKHLPSPIHIAARSCGLEIIQLLHSHGAGLNRDITPEWEPHWRWAFRPPRNFPEPICSPVMAAMLSSNLQVVQFFAQQGIQFPPWAAYYGACYRSSPHFVQLALEMGADPNWTDKNGFSALQAALEYPRPEEHRTLKRRVADAVQIAITLLDAGAVLTGGEIPKAILLNIWVLINRLSGMDHLSASQRHDSMSILEAIIANGNRHLTMQTLASYPDVYDAGALCASVFFEGYGVDTVAYLLANRPQVEDVVPMENLAIGIAAWRERQDLLGLLLAKFRRLSRALLPESMISALINGLPSAVSAGEKVDKFLTDPIVRYRTNKRLFWREGIMVPCSPLILALKSETSVARLLNHGFLPDRLTMSIAAELSKDGPIRHVALCPTIFPGFENWEGPLAGAVWRGDTDGIKSLLDGNHRIDECNNLVPVGLNPLQMAVECGYLDLIQLLLEAGADVNAPAARDSGATALQLAAIKGYLGVAKMLVDLGADVNAPAALKNGRTALEGAAENGRIDTIQYLLSKGAQTSAEGRLSYLRAIRYAELEGHLVAAKLLKTWRDWTADDDALWDDLQFCSKRECEQFIKEAEDRSPSESEQESQTPDDILMGDDLDDDDLGDIPTGEAPAHEVSDTADLGGGIISELEDLEMMTSDTLTFFTGP